MIYFVALIPATGLVIGGYLALYISSRSEGTLRTFGKYLGFWAFTLAALVILGAIFAAAHGRHHHHHHGRMGMRGEFNGRMQGPRGGGPGFMRPPMGEFRFFDRGPGPNGPMSRPPVPGPSPSVSSSSTSGAAK